MHQGIEIAAIAQLNFKQLMSKLVRRNKAKKHIILYNCVKRISITNFMKNGSVTYKYFKQLNGKGVYGVVTIQIIQTNNETKVTDACEWTALREAYPNFVMSNHLTLWKQSAINAATYVVKNYAFLHNIEVIISDVVGNDVDTCPSHIGAAIIIGIFDYCDKQLTKKDLALLDDFIKSNNDL